MKRLWWIPVALLLLVTHVHSQQLIQSTGLGCPEVGGDCTAGEPWQFCSSNGRPYYCKNVSGEEYEWTAAVDQGAPVGAGYVVGVDDLALTGEQVLGALATGILKSTTSSGTLSIAAAGTDYVAPAGNVATATALAANGSNCSAGQAAAGVNATGVAEGCAAYLTVVPSDAGGHWGWQRWSDGSQSDSDTGTEVCGKAPAGTCVTVYSDTVVATVHVLAVSTCGATQTGAFEAFCY